MRKRKLTTEDVQRIRELYKTTSSTITDLARSHKVSPTTINNVIEKKGAYSTQGAE